MSAHCAVSFVVKKKASEIGSFGTGLSNYGSIHVGMPPWFPHGSHADIVQIITKIFSFFKDGFSFNFRVSVYQNP